MRFARYGDKKKGPIPKRKSWTLVEWFIQEISSETFLSSMNEKGREQEKNQTSFAITTVKTGYQVVLIDNHSNLDCGMSKVSLSNNQEHHQRQEV